MHTRTLLDLRLCDESAVCAARFTCCLCGPALPFQTLLHSGSQTDSPHPSPPLPFPPLPSGTPPSSLCEVILSDSVGVSKYVNLYTAHQLTVRQLMCTRPVCACVRTSLSLALGNMVVARQILLIFNLSYLPCSVQFVNKNYCHAKNDLCVPLFCA